MSYALIFGLVICLVAVVVGFRFGWELLRQNGRILLRIEALEKQFEEIKAGSSNQEASTDERAERFGERSLANSKIKRDGLEPGTPAPEFRLPRLDGGKLALSELRGKWVLLVFSSPKCGPCNVLAPKLEKFHRKRPQLEMVMISRESPDQNRAKVKEFGLTFPVVLQTQWEVSRDYAYFATPVAYLIDSAGVITADVAVGVDAIVDLMGRAKWLLRQEGKAGKSPWFKRFFGRSRIFFGFLQSRRLHSPQSVAVVVGKNARSGEAGNSVV